MKILAIPNAHALAHVSRLLEISRELRKRGHEVVFAGCGKYLKVVEAENFATRELPYISVEQIIRAVRTQRLWELYPEMQLQGFIEAELALYKAYQPDMVFIDNRPTARTSAEHAGIKTVAVLNVHMSNYRKIPFLSLRNVLKTASLPGVRLSERIENFFELWFYDQLVMRGLNKIRKKLALPKLYSYEHEQADLTFFADIPEFNPVVRLPEGGQYIGPLTWHNKLPAPACLGELDANKPVVYLSLGSEGLDDLLEHLDELAKLDVQVVVAMGARKTEVVERLNIPDGIYLEEFINTELLLPHCDLVCCHGGNGTIYQALSYGLPLVVVATHQEQYYGGKRIQELGLGRALTLKQMKKRGFGLVIRAIWELIKNDSYRNAAREFSKHLQKRGAAAAAATTIERYRE